MPSLPRRPTTTGPAIGGRCPTSSTHSGAHGSCRCSSRTRRRRWGCPPCRCWGSSSCTEMRSRLHREERGSALTEAALVVPCLVLIVYWASALSDVLILKLKVAEAVRYALWESTVFKSPEQIDFDVQRRFADLRSPRQIRARHTGLVLYPLARDLSWRAHVDTTRAEASFFPTSVDAAARAMKFNTNGVALARVSLVRARHDGRPLIFGGGDLLGRRGANDLGRSRSLASFALQAPLPSQQPMRLVFDPWKACPSRRSIRSPGRT